MSPSWIWGDKITNERVARVGYNHFISNKGEWNNCFRKFSNRVLPPIFISTILQSVRKENLAHYFPYDVKLRLLAHSRSFLANQKARNAIVGAENLLKCEILPVMNHEFLNSQKSLLTYIRVIMCHHPHDLHFTTKILQYARNKRAHTSCMKSWLIIAATIRNLSGCEIKVWKTKSGFNGIWTHDLCDTGAVRYCYTCSLELRTHLGYNEYRCTCSESVEWAYDNWAYFLTL